MQNGMIASGVVEANLNEEGRFPDTRTRHDDAQVTGP
jgi:hypothetical protein